MLTDAYEKYLKGEQLLKEEDPGSWNEVSMLVDELPESLSKDSLWQFGKDKPCWSNIKVKIGKVIAEDLKKHPDLDHF